MNRVIVIVFFLLSFLFSACASFFAPFELPMGQQTTRLPLITSQTPVSELLLILDSIEGQHYETRVKILYQLAVKGESLVPSLSYEGRSLVLNTAASTIFNLKSCGLAYKYFLEQDTAVNMLQILIQNMNRAVNLEMMAALLSDAEILAKENLQVILLAAIGGILSELIDQSEYSSEVELVNSLVAAFQDANLSEIDIEEQISVILASLKESIGYDPGDYDDIIPPFFRAILYIKPENRPDVNSFMVAGSPASEWFFKVYYLIHGDAKN